MALPVWMANLIAYSLQIAILASAGTLLAYLFRLRLPRVSLVYWQILLLACLFVPAMQNWKHPAQFRAFATFEPVFYITPSTTVALNPKHPFLTTPEVIGLALVAGICLRLIWLALGFLRLRLFLRHSQPLTSAMPVDQNLFSRIGARARFFVSHEIDSPATVGIFSPMVILPGSFPGMSEPCREAIVCHELLHVRRRDWALIVVEEIVRSIYWFHPAVWWLLGRIHLAREQSVDREVVLLTGRRQPYLDSLLEIARSRGRPKAVPAPLFLRERHLVQRVALLIKEVSMNRLRLAVSLTGIAVLLTGTVRLAAGWFPLTGAPQVIQQQSVEPESTQPAQDSIGPGIPASKVEMAANAQPAVAPAPHPAKAGGREPKEEAVASAQVAPPQRDPIKVGGNVQESKLIHKVEPIYPEQALKARISGTVILLITVNEAGFVSDVQVTSGHPMLNEAAITAVKQWQYSPTLLNGEPVPVIATVTVVFAIDGVPPPPAGPVDLGPSIARFDGAVDVILQDGLGGHVIFRATPINEKGPPSSNTESFRRPELAMTLELFQQWHKMAEAGWPADVAKSMPLSYMFVVNEVGETKNFMRVQGPNIPDIESKLSQLRVITPGFRGSTPVSSLCVVQIALASAKDNPFSRMEQYFSLQRPPQTQLSGQLNNSAISGPVTDASDAVVPGTVVTATNLRTGTSLIAITDSAGIYSFSKIPPGSYKVSAEWRGFQTETPTEVQLGNGEEIRLKLKLKTAHNK